MALSRRRLPNYTYDDYAHWEGKWEVIEGIPYAMSPSASPNHQRICSTINVALANALSEKTCDFKVYHPVDIKIAENTIVQPDVLILCESPTKQFIDFPPVLVVEVVSPSTCEKDIHTKFELYQNFGVKYYLIVDPDVRKVMVYELSGKVYQEMSDYSTFSLTDGCEIAPDLGNVF